MRRNIINAGIALRVVGVAGLLGFPRGHRVAETDFFALETLLHMHGPSSKTFDALMLPCCCSRSPSRTNDPEVKASGCFVERLMATV